MTFDPDAVEQRLHDVRRRTRELVSPLPWETLRKQHVPILSPMVWDLGHVGTFEEMWLLERVAAREPLHPGYREMFDPTTNPRPTRAGLPLPDEATLWEFLDRVRGEAEAIAKDPDRFASRAAEDPDLARLLDRGFVFELVAEHEEQHQETLLQAMQVMEEPAYAPSRRRETPRPGPDAVPHGPGGAPEMVEIPAGPFLMGHGGGGFAYDNERGRHEVDLGAFRIQATPVTCGEYLELVREGGYEARELWSEAGWRWREEEGAVAPLYWRRDGGDGWRLRQMDRVVELPVDEPVCHVSHHEAEAYARLRGKRLPTEAEWEKAALWDPEREAQRLHPWGDEPPGPERANLDQLAFGPAAAGAYPAGASAYGVQQMTGDVWEWTASDFTAYPGFEAFPYAEYSEIFFGDEYKVLRGGSWATRPHLARGTLRNWDYPVRRQIFSGIRLADDG